MEVLWRDLQEAVPALAAGGLRVLDAGGGAGHLAVRVAALGNSVLLCDPSAEMLRRAEELARSLGLSSLTTLRRAIQDLPAEERFGLVTCHAVLEWLAEPAAAVGALARQVGPAGRLSLMFYNRNAALWKRMLGGDFAADLAAEAGREFPRALDEARVKEWLNAGGLRVVSRSGIRIVHDHLGLALDEAALERLIEAEWRLRKREPFASLAQHIHVVCEPA